MSDDVSSNFDSGAWEFTPEVVEVFDQHVADHVPYYDVFQNIVTHLSDWLAPDWSMVVDLGASTGTTSKQISDRHPERHLTFRLYDAEQPMLDAARAKHEAQPSTHTFEYFERDLAAESLNDDDASVDLVLALFTLQFISPTDRATVLREARRVARPGGALIVAEKVVQPSALWQEIANEETWDYKAERGVDAETIRSKARALRGVLRPLPPGAVEQLMSDAGWSSIVPIWRWHCWGLWAAEAL